MGEYATISDLASYGGSSVRADDFALKAALAAASGWVDAYCGRSFDYEGQETRTFTASSPTTVAIPDAAHVRSVTVSGREWPAGTWEATSPRRASVDAVWPAGKLVAVNRTWPSAHGAVAVDADWGWEDVPATVALATLMMALRLYKRRDAWEGVAGGGEFGAIRLARVDPDIAALLRPYKRFGIA